MNKNEEVDFRKFQSKIDEVVQLLGSMNNSSSTDSKDEEDLSQIKEHLSEDEFIVKITSDRTVINKTDPGTANEGQMGQIEFMQEIERDAARRAEERKKCESVAQNLKKLGNQAFREGNYERALCMYNKAIDHAKDSPALYNNRALTYIRMGLYKKAVIDSDFVLQKLDEKNIRSWLYRAKSYLLLGENRDFEKSINEAKKNNPKQLEFIDKTVAQILAENEKKI